MKAENWNKRTKRKEIQFSDEEYIAVEQKASAARIPGGGIYPPVCIGQDLVCGIEYRRTGDNEADFGH